MRKLGIVAILGVLGMVLAVLVICSQRLFDFSALEVATVSPIPPAPLPDFLDYVYPQPGATVSLKEYNSSGKKLPHREKSAVCITVNGESLLDGYNDWGGKSAVERTAITVDGQIQQEIAGGIENYLQVSQEVDKDTQVPVGPPVEIGPWHWCVSTSLKTGVHIVEVTVAKRSDDIDTFAWTFDLVE